MNDIQAMMDGMSAQWMRERAESQMTLGKLIERLESMPPDVTVERISEPHSYRGYYSDLAFEPCGMVAVKDVLEICRKAMGEVFEGYKGGDFQMGRNTPVWSASYGCCGKKIMAVNDDGTLVLAEDE